MRSLRSKLIVYLVGILAAFTLTLVLVMMVMQPPRNEFIDLGALLALTGAGSAVIGYLFHHFGWWRRIGSLTVILTLGYVLAAGLTLFNVWLTARLMFINEHDLALGGLLLFFAGGISISFGYFFSSSVSQAIQGLVKAAEKVSQGDFSPRVNANGKDEVSQLASAFNSMAERLEQAQESERALETARRNLVAGASHDLRTPLASLRAMLEALEDGVVSDPATIRRYLRQSRNEITRMSGLIDDLFELAQLDSGHVELRREWISFSDLASDALEGFTARALAKGVHLEGQVTAEDDLMWVAPDKISRVFNNLFENAIHHTSENGQVVCKVEDRDESLLVSIEDTGAGISESDLPHIFDRFYRGEKSRSREGYEVGSAGLGLAIAKSLVEAHGGRIWAEVKTGGGTVIRFVIPKASE